MTTSNHHDHIITIILWTADRTLFGTTSSRSPIFSDGLLIRKPTEHPHTGYISRYEANNDVSPLPTSFLGHHFFVSVEFRLRVEKPEGRSVVQ